MRHAYSECGVSSFAGTNSDDVRSCHAEALLQAVLFVHEDSAARILGKGTSNSHCTGFVGSSGKADNDFLP